VASIHESVPFPASCQGGSVVETFGPSLQPVVLGATTEAEDGALGCCIMTRRVEYNPGDSGPASVFGIPQARMQLTTCVSSTTTSLPCRNTRPEFVARLIARLKQLPSRSVLRERYP